MKAPRTFSKDESDDVFRVALELEKQSVTVSTDLTADQLEAIGTEVGLSPERVRDTIAVIDATPASSGGFWGAPRTICVEREIAFVAGTERDDELIDLVRREIGVHGTLEREGNTLIWSAQRRYSLLRVTLIRSSGGMRLRIVQNHNAFIIAVFNGCLVGVGAPAFVAAAYAAQYDFIPVYAAKLVGVAALVTAAAWLGTRAILTRRVQRDAMSLTDLLRQAIDAIR